MEGKGRRGSKVMCYKCRRACNGEVLRIQDKHFHIKCFTCKVCHLTLANGGFFEREGSYYCASDYQDLYGTRCKGCGEFVEGEVVTALGNTYHQCCFVCAHCGKKLPPGGKVTFNGKDVLCEECYQSTSSPSQQLPPDQPLPPTAQSAKCSVCNGIIKNGDSLLALNQHYHIKCFKCHKCQQVLSGEYMGKDGIPYCEKDYQSLFGVICANCNGYITGKVLQAGEKTYHPSCSKCLRCGEYFREGDEMFIQGSEIWHPDCSKVFNGLSKSPTYSPNQLNGHGKFDYNANRQTSNYLSPKMAASLPAYYSAGLSAGRGSGSVSPTSPDIQYSYLLSEVESGYSYPKSPAATQPDAKVASFHRPVTTYHDIFHPKPKGVIDSELSEQLIKESKFPAAEKPPPGQQPKIERDDWPSPPAPVTIGKLKSKSDRPLSKEEQDEKKQKALEQLEKIPSPLGRSILKDKILREELTQPEDLDPISASRSRDASRMPRSPPRLQSVGGSTYLTYDRANKSATLPIMGRSVGALNGSYVDDYNSYSMYNGKTRPYSYHSGWQNQDYDGYGDVFSPKSPGGLSEEDLRQMRIARGRSMPDIGPPKIYPIQALLTTNYKLPKDVDREHLEWHLSPDDFYLAFQMSIEEFELVPQWRQNELKKLVYLF